MDKYDLRVLREQAEAGIIEVLSPNELLALVDVVQAAKTYLNTHKDIDEVKLGWAVNKFLV